MAERTVACAARLGSCPPANSRSCSALFCICQHRTPPLAHTEQRRLISRAPEVQQQRPEVPLAHIRAGTPPLELLARERIEAIVLSTPHCPPRLLLRLVPQARLQTHQIRLGRGQLCAHSRQPRVAARKPPHHLRVGPHSRSKALPPHATVPHPLAHD